MRRGSIAAGSWARFALLLCAIATAGAAHQRIDTSARVDRGELFVPRPEQARLSSLGFGGIVAACAGIPIVNFVVVPAAVVGATILYVEELR